MGLSADRLQKTLTFLKECYPNEEVLDLHQTIDAFYKLHDRDIAEKNEGEFQKNLAIYTLQLLVELHAPVNILKAGFLLDAYLRPSGLQIIEKLPIDQQVFRFLRNTRELYKYELQLPWRKKTETSDFQEEVLQNLRKRALVDTAPSELSIQSAKKQHENHRWLIVSTAAEYDALIIKLADRISVLKNLKSESGLIKSIGTDVLLNNLATETLNIQVAIAERLGIWKLKWPLQDLAFRILDPKEYQAISKEVVVNRETRDQYLSDIIKTLESIIANEGIDAKISGRPKSIYSIYKKKISQNLKIDQINDLLGVRIIVEDEANKDDSENNSDPKASKAVLDCYAILDILLSLWEVPTVKDENGKEKSFYEDGKYSRDWIDHPKPNKYQSIHTTILHSLPDGKKQPVEVQIRTKKMHLHAESGVAAHWLYKEKAKPLTHLESKEDSWNLVRKKLNDQVEQHANGKAAKSVSFMEEKVFCLTPKGEILPFPKEATPIDFAYRIHKEVGNRIMIVKVNNRIVPLNYKLQNGDVVEIVISKTEKGPNPKWLLSSNEFVKSNKTIAKIRRWFKEHV